MRAMLTTLVAFAAGGCASSGDSNGIDDAAIKEAAKACRSAIVAATGVETLPGSVTLAHKDETVSHSMDLLFASDADPFVCFFKDSKLTELMLGNESFFDKIPEQMKAF